MKFMYQFYFIAIKESVAWLLFKVVLQHPLKFLIIYNKMIDTFIFMVRLLQKSIAPRL